MRITENHRALWIYYDEHREELARIFTAADLRKHPITPQESRFIQFFINHVAMTFRTQQMGLYTGPEQLETDLRDFFSWPVPRAGWEKLRRFQDRDFTLFIDRIISSKSESGNSVLRT